jgi:hypothetical protein
MADKREGKLAQTGAAIGGAVGALIGLVGGPLGVVAGGGLVLGLGHHASKWFGNPL